MLNRFRIFRDLSHLIYPEVCLVCENELSDNESSVCSFCDDNIVKTNYHLFTEPTDMDRLFWGRAKTEYTYAYMVFKKGTPSQDILMNLKYKNNSEIGVFFGKRIGKLLQNKKEATDLDAIIPVPLHPKKKFIRGYNQSERIAKGISDVLDVPIKKNLLIRTRHTSSQTNKSRFQRWDNVSEAFSSSPDMSKYKHVAIIDDVITTGSTVENLIQIIHTQNPNIKVSVVTLAIA